VTSAASEDRLCFWHQLSHKAPSTLDIAGDCTTRWLSRGPQQIRAKNVRTRRINAVAVGMSAAAAAAAAAATAAAAAVDAIPRAYLPPPRRSCARHRAVLLCFGFARWPRAGAGTEQIVHCSLFRSAHLPPPSPPRPLAVSRSTPLDLQPIYCIKRRSLYRSTRLSQV
jgi:hypothetical protein